MTEALFIISALFALLFFYLGAGQDRKIAALFAGWGALVAVAALSGIFQRHPRGFLLVVAGSVCCTIYGYRRMRKRSLNYPWLLAVHALRVAVEWGLYRLFLQGSVPELMTFHGWNYDIVMGLTALLLLACCLLSRQHMNKPLFTAWNIAGLLFLTTIVVLAILSAPLPVQQLAFKQPNVAMLAAPYCLLPAVIVPLVFLAHLRLLIPERRA